MLEVAIGARRLGPERPVTTRTTPGTAGWAPSCSRGRIRDASPTAPLALGHARGNPPRPYAGPRRGRDANTKRVTPTTATLKRHVLVRAVGDRGRAWRTPRETGAHPRCRRDADHRIQRNANMKEHREGLASSISSHLRQSLLRRGSHAIVGRRLQKALLERDVDGGDLL